MGMVADNAGQEDLRVMLVEDSPEQRMTLRNQLSQCKGNATVVGETGVDSEALTMLLELKPDLVFIELQEPLARPLRILESMSVTGQAPIIAISSSRDRESLRKAMRAGAREYLVKPLKAEELSRTIDTVMDTEQRRKALVSKGAGAGTLGEVICVLGAKGGIGKTTLATNLAVALARVTTRKVGLMDLNIELGDVPIMLDVVPDKNLADVIEVVERLDPELLKRFLTPHSSGVQILAASMELSRNNGAANDYIGRVVEVMAQSFDYVVVDTAPRLQGTFPSVLERSNMVLVLTTPDVAGLKNTRLMLDGLKTQRSNSEKVKLVLNNPYGISGARADEAGKMLAHPVFWSIPYDGIASQCVKVGKSCIELNARAKISRNLTDLASTLSGEKKASKRFMGLFG